MPKPILECQFVTNIKKQSIEVPPKSLKAARLAFGCKRPCNDCLHLKVLRFSK